MQLKKVTILDYNAGNLFSVHEAAKQTGLSVKVSSSALDIENTDGLIIPGVGAFKEAMKSLDKLNLINPIKDYISSGRPFMGICLGMQLLFNKSYEFGETEGLGLIDGEIKKFPEVDEEEQKIPIPHIGWSKLNFHNKEIFLKSPLRSITKDQYVYFVHSFYAHTREKNITLAEGNYGNIDYCAALKKDNIFATQFHPEKSGKVGIQIINHWAKQHLI